MPKSCRRACRRALSHRRSQAGKRTQRGAASPAQVQRGGDCRWRWSTVSRTVGVTRVHQIRFRSPSHRIASSPCAALRCDTLESSQSSAVPCLACRSVCPADDGLLCCVLCIVRTLHGLTPPHHGGGDQMDRGHHHLLPPTTRTTTHTTPPAGAWNQAYLDGSRVVQGSLSLRRPSS